MSKNVRLVRNNRGWSDMERKLATGVYAIALDAETEGKREAPVRGGYRSFVPGTSPIGGTLRRSVHSVGYGVNGELVGEHSEDGKPPLAEEVAEPGRIAAYAGTNSGYGAFVELGTIKMPARAFLAPGADIALSRGTATMRAAIARMR